MDENTGGGDRNTATATIGRSSGLVPLPWPTLQARLGGLPAGVTAIVGPPDCYKTWLALHVANRAATAGIKLLVTSFALHRGELAHRFALLRRANGVAFQEHNLRLVSPQLSDLRILVGERVPSLLVVDGIRREALDDVEQCAIGGAVLVTMPYPRKMPGSKDMPRPENRLSVSRVRSSRRVELRASWNGLFAATSVHALPDDGDFAEIKR